jgi:hypothetical protein
MPTTIRRRKKARSTEPRPAYAPTGVKVADQVAGRWVPPLVPRGISVSDLHGGLPAVTHVPVDEPIILVEGHGPAIALNAAGIPAVATVTGKAGTISETGASLLYGRKVVLSPDVGGEEHMQRCAAVVARVAETVLIAPSWPDDMAEGEDAAQYLERHGADAIRTFYAEATPWQPDTSHLSRPVLEIERHDPEPLVDDFAHPSAHTILYGPNGKGKGVFAAWKIAARTHAGETVLILDYEGHPGEWRSRLEDLGADMTKVYLALPFGMEGGLLKGAIWEQQDAIRDEADRVGADWLYVDSVTAACGIADIKETTAPGPYFAALNAIGRASVSLGHVTKAEELAYPFGSMAWRAFVRMAWSFSGEGDVRELVNRKSNDYPEQRSLAFDWSWVVDYGPRSVPPTLTESAAVITAEARAWEAIGEDDVNVDEIIARVNADGREHVAVKTLKNKISASPRFEKVPGKRGYWRRIRLVHLRRAWRRDSSGKAGETLTRERIGTNRGNTGEDRLRPRSQGREKRPLRGFSRSSPP